MWIFTSLNRPVGLAMVSLAIFRLKGDGDGFGSPSLQRSSSVMTLTPNPPSNRFNIINYIFADADRNYRHVFVDGLGSDNQLLGSGGSAWWCHDFG